MDEGAAPSGASAPPRRIDGGRVVGNGGGNIDLGLSLFGTSVKPPNKKQ